MIQTRLATTPRTTKFGVVYMRVRVRVLLGQPRPIQRGGAQRSRLLGLLLMPTPFVIERPNLAW